MWFVLCILGLALSRTVGGSTIADQMAETTHVCCAKGTDFARSPGSKDCSSSAPPDVPPAFSSLCIFAMDQCCKEYFQKKQECDAGAEVAMNTDACESAPQPSKDCCNQCVRGKFAGSIGSIDGCKDDTASDTVEGVLGGEAYLQCCKKAANESVAKTRDSTRDSSVSAHHGSKPVTLSRSLLETLVSICEEYAPNELCAHHCIPIPGSYKCECNPGFRLMSDGRNCIEVVKNRCKPRNPCQHKCNDNGVQVKCSCRRGYQLMADGKSCEDIDECSEDPPACLPSTECYNVQGSYKCIPKKNYSPKETGQCPDGFTKNPRNNACDDVNECALPNPPCPPYLCSNTVGGYKCGGVSGDPANLGTRNQVRLPDDRCPPGFSMDFKEECEDVDECALHKDDCNPLSQFCINTRGSFYCQDKVSKHCLPGFKSDPVTNKCEDINECEDGQDICRPEQICVNVPGQYDCKPRNGYRKKHDEKCPEGMRRNRDSNMCEDIDECLEGTHLCDSHQSCLNTNGSHECRCKLGYELDAITGSCVDVNECATDSHNCVRGSQRCDNTIGSFLCVRFASCGTGYILESASGNCEDIDECALGTHNCAFAGPDWHCENRPGSFRCLRNTTTTTAAPEYEYEYYDSVEVLDNATNPSQNPPEKKPEQAPTTTTTPAPTNPPEVNSLSVLDAKRPPDTPQNPDNSPEPKTEEESPEKPQYQPEPQNPDLRQPESEQPNLLPEPRQPESRQPVPQQPEPQKPDNQQPESIQPESEQPGYQQPESESPKLNPTAPSEQPENQNPEPPQPTEQDRADTQVSHPEEPLEHTPNYYKTDFSSPTSPRVVYVDVGKETATIAGEKREDGSVFVDTGIIPKNEWTKVNQKPSNCRIGFELDQNGNCIDIDECAKNLHSCSGLTETCRNTVGGYLCDCAAGFRRDLQSGDCHVITTSSSTTSTTTSTERTFFWGYPEYKPVTTRPFRPRTLCDFGYHYNSETRQCDDIDECTNGQANCAAVELCINTMGGYRCECPPNWQLDEARQRCVPKRTGSGMPPGYHNEPIQPPPPNQRELQQTFKGHKVVDPEVVDFGDSRAVITCPSGYQLGYENTCEDVDECATGEARCGEMLCTNLAGGYVCSCPQGHKLVDGARCEDVDECALQSNMPICSQNANCVNTVGSFQCKCHDGFRSAPVNDKVCVDVDECTESDARSLCQHRCNNVWGGYRCSCHRGYRLNPDNSTCSDIDECTEHKSKIPCVGRCVNEPGSYRCTCPHGYRLSEDKRSCIDIDECETGEAPCAGSHGSNDVCLNTRGGFRCQKVNCPPGYKLENKHRCTRIEKVCPPADWECAHQPTTYSYNYITFVSKLYIPDSKVDLFTMRGPSWPGATMRFQLRLFNVDAPPSVKERADINSFLLVHTGHQAVMSLVRSLEGPQSIELELSMELYNGEQFGGIAVAKLFIYVSEFEF